MNANTPTPKALEAELNQNQRALCKMTVDVARAVMTKQEFIEVIMFLYACIVQAHHEPILFRSDL